MRLLRPTLATPKGAIHSVLWALACLVAGPGYTEEESYHLPSKEIVESLNLPQPKGVSVSPDRKWILLTRFKGMPPIADFAAPTVNLARHQINTRTNGSILNIPEGGTGFDLVQAKDGFSWPLDAPPAGLSTPLWSPDSRHFVFLRTLQTGIELWIGDPQSRTVHSLTPPHINAALNFEDVPCNWMPDGRRVLCFTVPTDRGDVPQRFDQSISPDVQVGSGHQAPVRVYGGLLRDSHDEALFDYYLTSQAMLIDIETGLETPVGAPAVYEMLRPSPSGRYLLAVKLLRPYPHIHVINDFPKAVEVWDAAGHKLRTLASLAANDSGWGTVGYASSGPRRFGWVPDQSDTISYIQALDGGDIRREVPYRDQLLLLKYPFNGPPIDVIRTRGRLSPYPSGVRWSEDRNVGWVAGGRAWVEEVDSFTHEKRVWLVDTHRPASSPHLLFKFNDDDWYSQPGSPVRLRGGARIMVFDQEEPQLITNGEWVYLAGFGGTPTGDRPFLDRLNLNTGRRQRLFQSGEAEYERVVDVLDAQKPVLLISRETQDEPRNYYLFDVKERRRVAITQDRLPTEFVRTRSLRIDYERRDGIPLHSLVYLPERASQAALPIVVVAYPEELADTNSAGQVRGSKNRFIWGTPPLFPALRLLATQGYAVLWYPSMPVLGGSKANDTAAQQYVDAAQAAIDKLAQLGIGDRSRVAVIGHSYGGQMVATLLSHSNLFSAGIAIDGGYNMTTQPFGFQFEGRTFWEARDAYLQLSGAINADHIHAPLLLIHGELDTVSGTQLVEAQRMYEALSGLGRTVRLVTLPYEGHSPLARESIMDVEWEVLNWLNIHLQHKTALLGGAPSAQFVKRAQ